MSTENVSLIKLITGEILIGHCVLISAGVIHMAFPYLVNEENLLAYLPLTTNRYYTFSMKDIVFFKDVNNETKSKYCELVLAKEPKEYEPFIESTKEVAIPKNCFVHEGNSTIH